MKILDSFWGGINASLHGIDGNLILTLSVLIICGFFFYFVKGFKSKIKPVQNDLENANRLVAFSKDHRREFYNNFEKINKGLLENKSFSHSWHEFKEHIIFPTEQDVQSNDQQRLVIKNSIQPSFFFNEDNVIEENIDVRFLDAIPGKLTGLGILGTFVGLTIGIAGATYALGSLEKSDSDNLTSTLITLLQGASLAFLTSVLGISFSMIFSAMEKKEINNLKKNLRIFVESLEKSLKLVTNEQIAIQIHDSIREQNKKFDGFSNELAIALENSLSKTLKDPFTEGVGQLLNGLSSIRDVQQNFSNNLMNELVTKVTGNIAVHAQENQSKASKAFEELQEAFSRQAAEMVASQNAMASTSRQLLNEISHTSKTHQDELNKQLKDTVSSMTDVLENINSKFRENIVNSSTEISKVLGDTFNSVANDVQNRQREMKTEYQNSSETLLKVVGVANDIVVSGAKLIQSSSENLNKNETVMSSLRSVIMEQQKSVQLLDSCSVKINNSGNLFEKASSVLSVASTSIEATSRNINESNTKILAAWEGYSQRFENVDQALGKTFKEFTSGAESYQLAVNTYVKDLTKEYEKAISILGGQLDELSDLLDKGNKKS